MHPYIMYAYDCMYECIFYIGSTLHPYEFIISAVGKLGGHEKSVSSVSSISVGSSTDIHLPKYEDHHHVSTFYIELHLAREK